MGATRLWGADASPQVLASRPCSPPQFAPKSFIGAPPPAHYLPSWGPGGRRQGVAFRYFKRIYSYCIPIAECCFSLHFQFSWKTLYSLLQNRHNILLCVNNYVYSQLGSFYRRVWSYIYVYRDISKSSFWVLIYIYIEREKDICCVLSVFSVCRMQQRITRNNS